MTERRHEIVLELDTTPDAVWDALTNAEQIVRWFTPIARVVPGVGGTLGITWADGSEGQHEIVGWEPGRKLTLATRGQQIVFEIAAKGGGATLRLVHSGFGAESSFDDEFDATFGGWSTYLAVLKYAITTKRGEPIEQISRFTMLDRDRDSVWPIDVEMPMTEIARPAPGYLVGALTELNNSPLAVFCEKFGSQTCLTISAYLCGPARSQAEAVTAHIEKIIEDAKG